MGRVTGDAMGSAMVYVTGRAMDHVTGGAMGRAQSVRTAGQMASPVSPASPASPANPARTLRPRQASARMTATDRAAMADRRSVVLRVRLPGHRAAARRADLAALRPQWAAAARAGPARPARPHPAFQPYLMYLKRGSSGVPSSAAPGSRPGCHISTDSILAASAKSFSVMPLASCVCSLTMTKA